MESVDSFDGIPEPGINAKESIMSEFGKHKLSDAVPHPPKDEEAKHLGEKPQHTHEDVAEQLRESHESEEAKNAEASIRDRMVEIGRGNQQAGRQGHS